MIVVKWIIIYVQICTFIVGPSSYINGIVSVRTSGHDDQFLTLMKCYVCENSTSSSIHVSATF